MSLLRWTAGLFVAVAALTGVALAHASLKASNIAAGSVIEILPATFEMEFTQPIGLASFAIETDKGAAVPLRYALPKRMQAKFAVPLPRLSPGAYVAKWRTISKDGHAVTGAIPFKLVPPKKP